MDCFKLLDTQIVFLEEFLKKLILKKVSRRHENYHACKDVISLATKIIGLDKTSVKPDHLADLPADLDLHFFPKIV